MQRLNINELINQDYDFVRDGTSAMFLAVNPHNNKSGILKENGCMLGIFNEDLREKLASIILNLCGVETAEIDLCIDDEQKKYCLSYNVLKENQHHIQLNNFYINKKDKEEIFKQYMQNLSMSIICLPQISKQEYEEIKKRIIEIIFMDLIIDHYDRKTDNTKVIYDNTLKKYLPPISYDYGTAFEPGAIQKNGIFFYLTNEEVMDFLIQFHYQELESLVTRIKENLSVENLKTILSREEFENLNPELIFMQIQKRLFQLEKLLINNQQYEYTEEKYEGKQF